MTHCSPRYLLAVFLLLAFWPTAHHFAERPQSPLPLGTQQAEVNDLRKGLQGELTICTSHFCPRSGNWWTYRNVDFGVEISFPLDFWTPSDHITQDRLYFILGTPRQSPYFFRTIEILTPTDPNPFHWLITRDKMTEQSLQKMPKKVRQLLDEPGKVDIQWIDLNETKLLALRNAIRRTDGFVKGRALYNPANNLVVWTTEELLSYRDGESPEAVENITAILDTLHFFPPTKETQK